MRVLICGDRNWTDPYPIQREISRFIHNQRGLPDDEPVIFIHGAARGADSIGGRLAAECGYTVEAYPADWTTYGRAAGPIRNKQMLDSGIDLVLAFHPDLLQSKGTANMVHQARKAGVKVEVYDH